jgi:hypothetical protein
MTVALSGSCSGLSISQTELKLLEMTGFDKQSGIAVYFLPPGQSFSLRLGFQALKRKTRATPHVDSISSLTSGRLRREAIDIGSRRTASEIVS